MEREKGREMRCEMERGAEREEMGWRGEYGWENLEEEEAWL